MPQVDPDDDTIERFVVQSYRYDADRYERRLVVQVAFDNVREFEAAVELASTDLRRRRDAGENVDPREHVGGVVLEPGYYSKQRAARFLKNAVAHGATPDAATWSRVGTGRAPSDPETQR